MKTILLVEDDPFILDVYSTRFKREDFNVEIATDGQAALDKIRHHCPDLLTLDIDLPKVNGCEVLKVLRSDPKTKNLKVIVLSNYTDENIKEKYDVDLADFHIIKHFLKIETPIEDIIQAIKGAFN